VRTRDHVHGNHLAYGARRFDAGIGCGPDSGDIPPHEGRDESTAYSLPTNDTHICSFDHRVRGLNHRRITSGFDHT
jgi:hypothetical protein